MLKSIQNDKRLTKRYLRIKDELRESVFCTCNLENPFRSRAVRNTDLIKNIKYRFYKKIKIFPSNLNFINSILGSFNRVFFENETFRLKGTVPVISTNDFKSNFSATVTFEFV